MMLGRNAKRKYAAEWRDLTYYSMISASPLGPARLRMGGEAEWDFEVGTQARYLRCGDFEYWQAYEDRRFFRDDDHIGLYIEGSDPVSAES